MKHLDLRLKSIEQQRAESYARMAKRMRRAAPRAATTPMICAATTRGSYAGSELSAPAVRPGADDSLKLPSRIGNALHYRDGRVVALTLLT